MRRVLSVVVGLSVMGWVSGCGGGPVSPPPPPPSPPVSGSQLTLTCARRALGAFDSARALLPGATLACEARVADQSGVPIEGAPLTFLVEAGQSRGAGQSGPDGLLSLDYQAGLPLPVDVAPGTYEPAPVLDATHTGVPLAPAWMMPTRWVENPLTLLVISEGQRVYTLAEPRRPDPLRASPDGGRMLNNPRDNLVTLVAVAPGAEGFTDVNADGTRNDGEPFVDLTEPFVDADDDGTWSAGEAFVDTNENGQWDGKNGTWDEKTNVWVQERVLWTGLPANEDRAIILPGVSGHRPTVVVRRSPLELRCAVGSGQQCPQATTLPAAGQPWHAFLADPWFNTPAREPAETCALAPAEEPLVLRLGVPRLPTPTDLFSAGYEVIIDVADVRDPNDPTTWTPRRVVPVAVERRLECAHTPGEGRAAASLQLPVLLSID